MNARTGLVMMAAALLAACGNPGAGGGGAALEGRVSDDTGTQRQGLSSDELGGSGSVSSASKVRLSRLKADGTLEQLAEAMVSSGGRYQLDAPVNETRL